MAKTAADLMVGMCGGNASDCRYSCGPDEKGKAVYCDAFRSLDAIPADAVDQIASLKATLEEMREQAFDSLVQACSQDGEIDHMCMSTWESSVYYFEQLGWLKQVGGRTYRVVPAAEREQPDGKAT